MPRPQARRSPPTRVGLIPFVLIRSAVATFYARRDTATPVKAALIGVAVNVALKIALVGPLAQVGLAFATAVGAWINLSLVIAFAARAGYLQLDAALTRSLTKFGRRRRRIGGGTVAGGTAFRPPTCSGLSTLHDEAVFLLLIVVGALVYAGAVLLLFGRRWVMSLVKG